MAKTLDLKKSVYDLIKEYPEIAGIMTELGFESIANPAMLNTAGRIMTLPKGAKMKNINLEHIKEVFRAKGFDIQSD